MNAKFKFILGIFLTLILVRNYSQNVTIDLISINNQSTAFNCGTIDLGTNQDNTLNIMFTITNNIGGEGTAKVMLKYSSTDYGYQIGNQINIPSSSWNNSNQYSNTFFNVNIQASQIQESGSTLYVQYTRNAAQDDPKKSCEFPIIKTLPPSFSMSPSSASIPCNDLTNRTFTVTPSNIPSGATVSYQWSYPGWTMVSNTSTSVTLKPSSATTLPSNVRVTPSINGVAQASKTSVVSRESFTNSATISGNANICPSNPTSVYNISDIGLGNTILWSLSNNNNIATILSSNATSATVMGIQNGSVTLIATITNPCGQTSVKTFGINVLTSSNVGGLANYSNSGYLNYCTNQLHPCGWQEKDIAITLSNVKPSNFQFSIVLGNAIIQNTVPPKSCYGCNSGDQPKWLATLYGIFYSSPLIVNVKANYSCNISGPNNISYLTLQGFNNRLSNTKNSFEIKLTPNKASQNVKITKEEFDIPYEKVVDKYLYRDLTDEEVETLRNEINALEKSKNEKITVSIFDFNGKLVYSSEMLNDELDINISKFEKGIYLVDITRGVEKTNEKLIVE